MTSSVTIIIIVGVVLAVILVAVSVFICMRRKNASL